MHYETPLYDDEAQFFAGRFEDAKTALRLLADSSGMDAAAAAFGPGVSGSMVASTIRGLDEAGWPRLVLIDEQVLQGARGAYDRAADTIYISRELAHAGSAAVTAVLIEELGHAIDARVNEVDASGDEGAIFVAHVLGQPPTTAELAVLQSEDDSTTIDLHGASIAVELAGEVVGSITLDGNLTDWTAADQIDSALSVSGYDIYAKATGGAYVFALSAPVAIGADTTAWLNTDRNSATGHQIFGFAGGAEYNVNFDATGTPGLYIGNAGEILLGGAPIAFGFSGDRTAVEFAVPMAAIGSPRAIDTLWDINNNTFLPTDYSAAQYTVVGSIAPAPVVGSITLDGNLADWTAADQIDSSLSTSGYDIYAKATGGSYVFALQAPVAIGTGTTTWLNTDQNSATGYKIWGFAGGAEYNIDFDAAGVPRLYTGDAGQTLVPGALVTYGYSADRTVVEFAVASSAIGAPNAINTLWDINNNTFLPTDYSAAQYTVVGSIAPAPVVGSITLDGNLADWTAADQIDSSLSASGYDIYAKATGGSYVFALQAPVAIGTGTTTWLNTDQNSATGYKIWGFAGGAEYNIDFDAAGVPRLYTGDAGQTLVPGAIVSYGYSADRTVVEFAVASSAIGAPNAINTLWDINNNTFLPTDYSATQYTVAGAPAPAPVVGSITLDGNLADWTAAHQIDSSLSVSGYDIYARATGGSYVFALKAPVAIGADTTAWLNTDQDTATGFRIWGFAAGAEYNINFDASGVPHLYSGDAGQTPVAGASVLYGFSADRTVVEFAVQSSTIGSPQAIDTLWDINNNAFLPTDFTATPYEVVDPSVGSVTLDGNLAEWRADQRIDDALSVPGYELYAQAMGGSFVFAINAPVPIDANTTLWLNTDQNVATGFQIFGSTGGAEYNINFDASGVPRLYTGDAGQTLVPDVTIAHGYSADRMTVEFALSKNAIGSPLIVGTLWDVNNATFLPTNYAAAQYEVLNLPPRTDLSHKVGIVYSETTANNYFSKMAYSQLFMAAQNQAAMAGINYEILTEADLSNLDKLVNFDALIFPRFSHVQSDQVAAIESTLAFATEHYDISLVAAGEFMTNDQTGAALPGDSYARMKSLLGLQLATGGFPADVTVNAADIAHPMMQDYGASELIRSYSSVGWLAFAPTTPDGGPVLATQTVNGQTHGAVIATTTGGNNIHFATESLLADNNLLWQAIDYAVNDSGISTGLQLSRQASIVASRVDMDQAMETFDVSPDGEPGIYDTLLPLLAEWKATYDYVASYYVDIGDQPPDQMTDWWISGEYYRQLLEMGNELGSHSVSHPHVTDALTPAEIQYEFEVSKQIIEQQMSQILGEPFTVEGAAIPGAPENFDTALAILQYYSYISGGFSSVGAGYPGAFGYLNPAMAGLDKVYLAPNVTFDFSLVEFQGLTPEQAAAQWQIEWANLTAHSDVPVLLWPWHDYAAAVWPTSPPAPSPYTMAMFTDFIDRAYDAGAEFVTLDDLADRISAFGDAKLTTSVSGNTVVATVQSQDAGKFALDLDNIGSQTIARVSDWYAYDDDSVFLPRDGGTYTIELGSTADDVTRVVSLPMRSELVSLDGNGTELSFSVTGEGRIIVDLRNPAAHQYVVTGARAVALNGERVELALDGMRQHSVSLTQSAANLAPVIYSAAGGITASLSIAENTAAVGVVAAFDPNIGQTVTYDITGGADAATFSIDAASGALAFVTTPDFDAPADAGLDNVYNVVVAARDNLGAVDTQTLAVSVTNVAGMTLTGDSAGNTLTGSGEEDTLSGLAGNDTLVGLAGSDTLSGGDGDDILNGGPGADRMTGGAGNDTYHVDHIGDIVIEAAGEGIDVVLSSITYTLPAHIENLTLTGSAPANGTGNAAANIINGNGAANTLIGGEGNDTINGGGGNDVLVGGLGADTLTGGTGSDRFDYNALDEGLDTITDFTPGAGGDVLDIRDVLVGYTAGSSDIDDFVQLTGGTSTTISLNADGAGTDFVSLATLQNVAMTGSLLNEMLANENLAVA